MKPIRFQQLSALVLVLAAVSCGANTRLSSSWSEPRAAGETFRKLVVVGVAATDAERRRYEDAFVRELQLHGVEGVPSYTLLPVARIEREPGVEAIHRSGADGVVITRLVGEEILALHRARAGTVTTLPEEYHGGWYGYYEATSSVLVQAPGDTTTRTRQRIETNLYDLEGDRLAWTGLTDSFLDAVSPESFLEPMVDAIVSDLAQRKLIPMERTR